MIFEKKTIVPASATDHTVGVGLVGAVTFMQDNMCEFFGQMGCDGLTMIPVCNAFFVITKTKIKFHKKCKWREDVVLKTVVSDVSKIRVNLVNNIYVENGVCIEGIQELCAIDKDSRSIRSVESTLFPKDIETQESVGDLKYTKFDFNLNEFELKKIIEINLSNVDYYKHTNNVEYVKFCMSVLDSEMFENNVVDTFEIHYIKESVIGDKLSIYVNQKGDKIDFVFMKDDDVCVKAEIAFRGRN